MEIKTNASPIEAIFTPLWQQHLAPKEKPVKIPAPEESEGHMFITRFTKKDGFIEDYYYRSLNDAIWHLDLFEDDDSDLYSSISVMDDTSNTIIKILTFPS